MLKLFTTNPLLSPHTLVKDQGYAINKYIREKKKKYMKLPLS